MSAVLSTAAQKGAVKAAIDAFKRGQLPPRSECAYHAAALEVVLGRIEKAEKLAAEKKTGERR